MTWGKKMNLIVPLNISERKSRQLELSDLTKDTIQTLHQENVAVKNRNRIKTFDAQLESSEITQNKMNQNNYCDNIVLDSIQTSSKKRELEDKLTEVDESDIEICHCLGKLSKLIIRL